MTAERCRLFFALWPDSTLQLWCADWVKQTLAQHHGRPVPAVNLHITLAFVGDVERERHAGIEAVAGGVEGSAFTLSLDRLGYWRRPQVIWLGASDTPPALEAMVKRLRKGLKGCDIEIDSRPFNAHMTVMRKVKQRPVGIVLPTVAWPVNDFVLVSSQLRPEGACYRVLKRWPLR